MENLSDLSIESIVENNSRIASIIRAHKIDYLMKTDISLKNACELLKISDIQLESEIQNIISNNYISKIDSSSLSLNVLTDYIEFNFHRYFYNQIPVIIADITNIAEDYFDKDPCFIEIRNLILNLSENLTKRILVEERDLFSPLRTILFKIKTNKPLLGNYGNIHAIIATIDNENYNFLANANYIIELMNNCLSSNNISDELTLQRLNSFNKILIDYINTQRNVLFPKSKDLFKSLNF